MKNVIKNNCYLKYIKIFEHFKLKLQKKKTLLLPLKHQNFF